MRRLITAILFVIGSTPGYLLAQKTDTIVLPNGDRITGEIKFLERGRLDYSTDHMRRISIDWRQVVRVSSDKRFDFELSNAKRYIGRIEDAGEDGMMVILTDTSKLFVRIAEVVRIEPLRSSFWGRMKGSSFEIGFDFTHANLQRVWNLTTKLKYRSKKWLLTFDGDSYVNIQEEKDPSRRHSAALTPQRFLVGATTAFVVAKVESNDELNLQLRATGAAGASHFFVRTNRSSLEARLALATTREHYTGSDFTTNLEAQVGLDYSRFEFVLPKVDMWINGTAYPSLTTWRRIRSTVNASVQWEPISDFRIGFSGFIEHDNRPAEGSPKVDYGIFSTVGYSL